jgi:hypothetical protein
MTSMMKWSPYRLLLVKNTNIIESPIYGHLDRTDGQMYTFIAQRNVACDNHENKKVMRNVTMAGQTFFYPIGAFRQSLI